MEDCTFRPNADKKLPAKDYKSTVDNLYQDGVTKLRQKKNAEVKMDEGEDLRMCTFSPKINH